MLFTYIYIIIYYIIYILNIHKSESAQVGHLHRPLGTLLFTLF